MFGLKFAIDAGQHPAIRAVGDRCRTRIFILADDVSGAWHQGRHRQFRHLFELAGNIVLYAAGGEVPPGRLERRHRPAPAPPARKLISLARLKYDGDYHVCPLAIPRLSDMLARSLSIGLEELPPADPSQPIRPGITLLWLTGNVAPKFSKAQQANIRAYVQAGGTLLIDPAIGRAEFRDAAVSFLEETFGPEALKPLSSRGPLVTGGIAGGIGADAAKVQFARSPATQPVAPELSGVVVNGRIAVVLFPRGLTCSIEGNPCYENAGYRPADARKLGLNVILYAATASR